MKVFTVLFVALFFTPCNGNWWNGWNYLWSPIKFTCGVFVDPIKNYFHPPKANVKLPIYCPQGHIFYTASMNEKDLMNEFHKQCQCDCCPYGIDGHKWKNTGTFEKYFVKAIYSVI